MKKQECKSCGGSGTFCQRDGLCGKYNCSECKETTDCFSCNGKGHVWVKRIDIKVPDGYEYYSESMGTVTFVSENTDVPPECFLYPYEIGDKVEWECDVCSGGIIKHNNVADHDHCPICKGNPQRILTCSDIHVEGKGFVVTLVEEL